MTKNRNRQVEGGGHCVTKVGFLGSVLFWWTLHLSPCYFVLTAKNGNLEGFLKACFTGMQGKVNLKWL